eukprot:1146135-Pelagomonas_calceolata.AAC.19
MPVYRVCWLPFLLQAKPKGPAAASAHTHITYTHVHEHTQMLHTQTSRERNAHAAAFETVRTALSQAAAEQSLIDRVARRKVASEQVRDVASALPCL